jgi:hypothetical protein
MISKLPNSKVMKQSTSNRPTLQLHQRDSSFRARATKRTPDKLGSPPNPQNLAPLPILQYMEVEALGS